MFNDEQNKKLQDDERFIATNNSIPKINFFNGKAVANQLLSEREKLIQLAKEYELFNALEIKEKIDQGVKYYDHLTKEIAGAEEYLNNIKKEIGESQQTVELQEMGFYDFEHPAQSSVVLAESLKNVRTVIKESMKNNRAAFANSNFIFNNSQKEGNKFMTDMKKIMLKAYNSEAENAVKSVKSEKVDTAINKIEKSRVHVEKLGSMINLKINDGYHRARIDEVKLAFEHFKIVRLEKEKAREEAERLKEERKVEQELKKKQELLQKERKQKQLALDEMTASLAMNDSIIDKQKLAELEQEIKNIDKDIALTNDRAANLKAGYVYVISNIGSFGEGRVKIGMTRRAEPMERIKELGNASVPFGFDVHLIHYSENAVEIENKLHKIFDNRRVNLVNKRREHFYATPEEVKQEIMKLDGSIARFTNDAEAFDYNESKVIREKLMKNA